MEVELFIPCFIDQLYPQTAFNVVKLLEKAGVRVHYNPKQTCCGQPAFNSGYWDEASEVAMKFMNDFPGERPIVCPSASCAGFVKNNYSLLFKEDKEELQKAKRTGERIFEFTDFLVNKLFFTDFGAEFNSKITYHDSCAALREYGIKQEPRKLLQNVKGLKIIEMEHSDTCCGFGGTFSVKFEPISTAMAEQKVENALLTGAEYIVSVDSSCLLHMEGYIKKHQKAIKTIHIADVLAAGW